MDHSNDNRKMTCSLVYYIPLTVRIKVGGSFSRFKPELSYIYLLHEQEIWLLEFFLSRIYNLKSSATQNTKKPPFLVRNCGFPKRILRRFSVKEHNCGIILLNMGGPTSLDDVHPFLFNLFSDREIIRLGPKILQKPLAWLIARRRAPKSRAIYKTIGGGSPLAQITNQQAKALQNALRDGGNYSVTFAMRYWPPYGDEAIQTLLKQDINSIIALSLYPHYSKATAGSSIAHLQQSLKKIAPAMPLRIVSSWPSQPSYIKALTKNIKDGLQSFGSQQTEVVYSAHSLPVSFIEEGDPYVDHIEETIQEVEKFTGKKGRLCYQSKSGPVEWLSPSTPEMIEKLAKEGCKNILMVPISFVSDHIETLYEISILYKEQARKLGMSLKACDSLNTNPLFIQGLRELVLNARDDRVL